VTISKVVVSVPAITRTKPRFPRGQARRVHFSKKLQKQAFVPSLKRSKTQPTLVKGLADLVPCHLALATGNVVFAGPEKSPTTFVESL
jgi:hypothetical protein